MAAVEADPWAWWTAALANPKAIGKTIKITTTPEQGFYRVKPKNGAWEPVAIWMENDQWQALCGIQPDQRADDAHRLWENTNCRGNPISLEEYERVAERGEEWSDSDPTVAASKKPPRPGGFGDNSGDVPESEILKDEVETAKNGVKAYATITSDEVAGKAQSLRSRLLELAGTAEKKRVVLKAPHLEAGKAIDKEWQPVVKDAQDGADTIKKALAAWETKKLNERRKAELEEAQRVELARQAAEKARQEREAEEAAGNAGEPLEEAPPPAPEPEIVQQAPESATIKGSYGRAASVSTKWIVAEVTDQDALYAFLKGHGEVKALLFELAKRGHKAGHTIPGVRLEEVAEVK